MALDIRKASDEQLLRWLNDEEITRPFDHEDLIEEANRRETAELARKGAALVQSYAKGVLR